MGKRKESILPQGGTIMARSYYADRANLYRLLQLHPDWTHQQFADALGRSRAWVKKWRKRFFWAQVHEEPLTQTLQGHSRARQTPVPSTSALVIARASTVSN